MEAAGCPETFVSIYQTNSLTFQSPRDLWVHHTAELRIP